MHTFVEFSPQPVKPGAFPEPILETKF